MRPRIPQGHDEPRRPASASVDRRAGERGEPERRHAEAEARFRLLAEAAPVGIFRFDAAGNCVYVNRCCCEMAGLPHEAVLGTGWLRAIHAEDRAAVYADFRRAVATGAPMEREFRLQRPDGTVVTVLGRSAVERANGEVQGFVGTVTDISERRRAERERDEVEKALEARERNFRAIIARDVDGVLVLDPEGRVLFANPAAEMMLGRPAEELRGQQLGLPLVTGEWTEVKPVRPDGKPIIAEMRVVHTEWSNTPAHLVSMHDVTERKQLERERIEHLERLHRAMFQTIQAVAQTIEKRDPYTAGHHQRVAGLAVAIGQEMGLSSDDLDGLRLAASIHDIGKIYVPAEILARPGTLTPIEFEFIKTHPEVGYEIVKDVEFRWPIAEIIRQHHERLDGSGYPRGLKDSDILAGARILAVADVVEAIASMRPYRAELGMQRALAEISENRGRLYDPAAVDACVRLIRDKGYVLERPAYVHEETPAGG